METALRGTIPIQNLKERLAAKPEHTDAKIQVHACTHTRTRARTYARAFACMYQHKLV